MRRKPTMRQVCDMQMMQATTPMLRVQIGMQEDVVRLTNAIWRLDQCRSCHPACGSMIDPVIDTLKASLSDKPVQIACCAEWQARFRDMIDPSAALTLLEQERQLEACA